MKFKKGMIAITNKKACDECDRIGCLSNYPEFKREVFIISSQGNHFNCFTGIQLKDGFICDSWNKQCFNVFKKITPDELLKLTAKCNHEKTRTWLKCKLKRIL